MLDDLCRKFKNGLMNRLIDKRLLISLSLLCAVYLAAAGALFGIYKHWLAILLLSIVLIFVSVIIAYTIIFVSIKKANRFHAKDYFRVKRVIKSLRNVAVSDVEILLPIIKSYGPDVNETIDSYRSLLNAKQPQNSVSLGSVFSSALSVICIISSAVTCQSYHDLLTMLALLFLLLLCAVLLYVAAKAMYRSVFYGFSKRALYERIDAALLEIKMKNLI